jgi:zinc D-Ala-D-Ala carboxypeptidase
MTTTDEIENQLLSPHFRLAEFLHSDVAEKHGIVLEAKPYQICNMRQLCRKVLEPLRNAEMHPVTIASGLRNVELNRLIGGAQLSQHLKGEAADIAFREQETAHRYFRFIRDHCDFDQLLLEWKQGSIICLHVSCKLNTKFNRHQAREYYAR